MKILIVSSSYPPVLGGLQTVAHTLAQHLVRQGHQIQVVTNRYPGSLPGREILDGVLVRRWLFLTPDFGHLRQRRPDLFVASLCFFPVTLFHLARLMRIFRPDVVNVHFPDAQIPFAPWLRRRFKFRLVVSLHGHDIERWFGMGKAFDSGRRTADSTLRSADSGLQSILREADAVTTCSGYLLDKAIQLETSVARKGYIIHNGIAPKRFLDRMPYEQPRPYILAYGRLSYQKGFDMLQEAFTRVVPDHPETDLILAGEGEERKMLQAQAQRVELNGRVHFYGRARPEEVVRLLKDSNLRRHMGVAGRSRVISRFTVDQVVHETLAVYGQAQRLS